MAARSVCFCHVLNQMYSKCEVMVTFSHIYLHTSLKQCYKMLLPGVNWQVSNVSVNSAMVVITTNATNTSKKHLVCHFL